MEESLLVESNLKMAGVPFDLNTGVFAGARIKLDKGQRLAIIVQLATSTAAIVTFDIDQHNAASAGTSKALATLNPYYKKVNTATSFTKVEPSVAADTYDLSSDFAANSGIVVFEVLQEDLDVNGDFAWVSINALDSTAAKLAAIHYEVLESECQPAYSTDL